MSTPETRVFMRKSASVGECIASTEFELVLPPGAVLDLGLIQAAAQMLATQQPEQAQSAARQAPTATPPAIGHPWPGQGGIYAGIMRGTEGQPDYHLILAEQALGKLAWGAEGTEVDGCDSDRDGHANTRALANAPSSHPAAEACAALRIDGHSDFYLPARLEMALLFANLSDRFEKRWHWSSTQYSASYAWLCYFDNGSQGYGGKSYEGSAVAVRRFAIESFNPSAAQGSAAEVQA